MVSKADARLPTVLKRLALTFALLVSALLPAAYFGVQYDGLVDHVQTTARVKAESIETLVVRNPEMWVFELQRMEDLLQQYPVQLERERVAVRSLAGEDMVVLGAPQAAPVLTRTADITDSGKAVARIELVHSYRHIVINTLIAALLGSVLGLGVYATLVLLPLRALRRATASLWQERQALAESEARFRSLTAMSSDFFWETDTEHRLTQRSANKKEAEGSVFHQHSPIGLRRWELPYLAPDESGWQQHREMLEAHLPFRDFEISRRAADGSVRHISLNGDPVFNAAGEFAGYRGVGTDITQRKAADEAIRNLAFFDPLTLLPNRRMLMDRLGQALASSERSSRQGALLFIDLDNFKTLNDTLGHDKGDLLLQQVSQRLGACVRHSDTVARFGGDEFVIMLVDLSTNPEEAAAQSKLVAEKILASFNQPYQLAGHQHRTSGSIGIALFCGRDQGINALLKQADIAMYQAKAAGRNALCFFDPATQPEPADAAAAPRATPGRGER